MDFATTGGVGAFPTRSVTVYKRYRASHTRPPVIPPHQIIAFTGHAGITPRCDAWGDPTAAPVVLLPGGADAPFVARHRARHRPRRLVCDLPRRPRPREAVGLTTATIRSTPSPRPARRRCDLPPPAGGVGASLGGITAMIAEGETPGVAAAVILVDVGGAHRDRRRRAGPRLHDGLPRWLREPGRGGRCRGQLSAASPRPRQLGGSPRACGKDRTAVGAGTGSPLPRRVTPALRHRQSASAGAARARTQHPDAPGTRTAEATCFRGRCQGFLTLVRTPTTSMCRRPEHGRGRPQRPLHRCGGALSRHPSAALNGATHATSTLRNHPAGGSAAVSVWGLRLLWLAGAFAASTPTSPAAVIWCAAGGPGRHHDPSRTGVAYISATDRPRRACRRPRPVPSCLRSERVTAALANLTPKADARFQPHGISLWAGADGRDSLFVVNHPMVGNTPDPNNIEIFDVTDTGPSIAPRSPTRCW